MERVFANICFVSPPAYSREQEKLRQQTAFISPPTEAGVFYGNMIKSGDYFPYLSGVETFSLKN